ncbi:MAG TPA: substrate binding domain-containing protein, partial [Polyangiaceae bacterium]|nr:substrate binding domain-containing protein [Polyangiaceae bacterium]
VRILSDLAEAEAAAGVSAIKPRGTLRVSVPVVFGRLHVAPLLATLMAEFSELTIELLLTDRYVDLVEEGVDLAIRIGALSDSNLIARRLCGNRRLLVASPRYLERRGVLMRIEDLAAHECLVCTVFPRPRQWRLRGPDGPATVTVSSRLCCNNAEMMVEAAKSGLGIALGATFAVFPALASGELVRVVPLVEFEPTWIVAVYPSARQLANKVRAVVDFFARSLAHPPSWDRALSGHLEGFEAMRALDS